MLMKHLYISITTATKHIANPIGTSLFGFSVSSAAVETASKPMYAKNITAVADIIPLNPYGANGI